MKSISTLSSRLQKPITSFWKLLIEAYASLALYDRSYLGKKIRIILVTVYLLHLIVGLRIFDLGIVLSFLSRLVIFVWFQTKLMIYFICITEFWLFLWMKSASAADSLPLLSLSIFFTTMIVILIVLLNKNKPKARCNGTKKEKNMPDIEKLVNSYAWKDISILELKSFLDELRLKHNLSMSAIEKITSKILEKNRFRLACSKPTKLYQVLEQIWNNNRPFVSGGGREFRLKLGQNLPSSLALDSEIFSQVIHSIIEEALHFSVGGGLQLAVSWLETSDISAHDFESSPLGAFEITNKNCVTDFALSDYPFFSLASIIQKICDARRENLPFLYSKGILKFSVSVSDYQVTKNLEGSEKKSERLALFLCRRIVEAMNGELKIIRRPNNSPEFIICLRSYTTISEACPPTFNRQIRKDQRKTPRSKGDQLRALIISDSFFVPSYAKFFQSKYFDVAGICRSATQVLETYKKVVVDEHKPIHVVLIEFTNLALSKKVMEGIRAFEISEGLDYSIINIVHSSFSEENQNSFLNNCDEIKADYLIQSPINYQDFECVMSLWQFQVRRANAFMKRAKILVADENPFVRAAIISMLDEEYSYIEAEKDTELLEVYAGNCFEFALVILNFSSAKENSFETLKEIKKIQAINNIEGLKVIAQVPKIEDGVLKDAMENDIDHIIEKPFKKSELKKLVRSTVHAFREEQL